MSDEPGRGKFVDQAAEARPSVWRRTAGWIREEILHSLGRPARLEGAIASGHLISCPIIAPVDTFWTRSVVYWQDWMSFSLSSFHSRPWTIDYRKPGYQRRLESHSLAVPEVQQLIRKENIPHFSCDITDIWGISASKSMDHDELFGSFFDAMNAFECPFGNSGLPRHMHDTDKSGVDLKLVWLERGHPRASAVADVLSAAGFPDFGKQLQQLAKEPSPR